MEKAGRCTREEGEARTEERSSFKGVVDVIYGSWDARDQWTGRLGERQKERESRATRTSPASLR